MEKVFHLNFSGNHIETTSYPEYPFVQIQVTFEENFPFEELNQLVDIIDKSSPFEQTFIIDQALQVAKNMEKKFKNSISTHYETWTFHINKALHHLKTVKTDSQSQEKQLPL